MNRQLYRSRSNKIIAGVCGGLAEYLQFDANIIRFVCLMLFFSAGIGFLPYIIAAVIVPKRPRMLREEDIRYVPRDEFDSSDW